MARGEGMGGARRGRILVAAVAALVTMLALTSSAAASPHVRTGTPRGIIPHHKGGTAFIGQFQYPQPSLQYYGGPVLRTNETFAIFWDPAGRFSQSYRDLIVRYLQDVAAD